MLSLLYDTYMMDNAGKKGRIETESCEIWSKSQPCYGCATCSLGWDNKEFW